MGEIQCNDLGHTVTVEVIKAPGGKRHAGALRSGPAIDPLEREFEGIERRKS